MLAYRLVRLIEAQSPTLADSLLDRVMESDLLRDYQKVPSSELQERVFEIYRHLGDWLLAQTISTSRSATSRSEPGARNRVFRSASDLDHHPDQGKPLGFSKTRSLPRSSRRNFR